MEGEGIPAQASAMNVRFMKSIGLLSSPERGRYIATPDAIRFINARSVSDQSARPILASLLAPTWFAELAKSVLKTQPFMSEDQFLGELALAAQADKTKEEDALRVIIEYLVYSGIVVRDERGLSLGQSESTTIPAQDELVPLRSISASAPDQLQPTPDKASAEASGWHVLQTEDFYVKIRSNLEAVQDLVDHLETIKKKITRLSAKGGTKNGGDEKNLE
jgi:hypothetical protein